MGERCIRRTWLLCLTLSCFSSPLLATAPVNFSRGQPEIGQPSDNIPIGPTVIKSMPEPIGDGRGYPMLLTNKTSILLGEALHMLSRVKNLKERHWIKNFIMQLGSLADMLMANAKNITIPPEVNTVDTEFRSRPTITTVEGPNDVNKHKVTSQADIETQNRVSIKNKTLINSQQSESIADDELVRQLKDVSTMDHNLRTFRSSTVVQHEKASVKTTTEDTLVFGFLTVDVEERESLEKEKEKEAILRRLANDVIRLRRLGGTREDVMKVLRFEDTGPDADFTDPEFFLDQSHKNEEAKINEIVEDIQNDEGENSTRLTKETKKNILTISSPNDSFRNQAMAAKPHPSAPNQSARRFSPQPLNQLSYMFPLHGYVAPQMFQNRPHPYYHAQQRSGMQMNGRYINQMRQPNYYQSYPFPRQMYPNGPHVERHYVNPQSPLYANPNAFVNPQAGQNFASQYGNPEVFSPYPTFANANAGQQYVGSESLSNRNPGQYQNMESLPPHPADPDAQYKDLHLYNNPAPKLFPYMSSNDNEFQPERSINMSSVHSTPSYPRVNYQPPYTDPNLSDELERQLRDGKIIVLSDSLVHSNFGPTAKDKGGEKDKSSTKAPNADDARKEKR